MTEEVKEEKKKPHPFDRAWAAGVFESKNPISDRHNRLQLDSAHEGMIRRFAEVVGVGSVIPKKAQKSPRPHWRWEVYNMDDARTVMILLVPFLSTSQIAKASQLVARIERNERWQKNNPDKKPVAAMMEAKATGS